MLLWKEVYILIGVHCCKNVLGENNRQLCNCKHNQIGYKIVTQNIIHLCDRTNVAYLFSVVNIKILQK